MPAVSKGRPTFCSISLEALRWNFRQVKKRVGPGVQVLSVVKANGYGHGAREAAKTLQDEGSDGFGVATLEEGTELRQAGIRAPVLILAGAYPEQSIEMFENNLTPAVCDLDMLRELDRVARTLGVALPFHLKVDTGMGRVGLLATEVDSWLPELRKSGALKLIGMFSHFSHAEGVEGEYTQRQLESFRHIVERLSAADVTPPLIHMANSAAVITLPSSHFTMVRPGLMLYGIYPAPEMKREVTLKPVLSWKTRILQLKRVPAGSSISYGQTFKTARETLIATLPVGYADGYNRLLSSRGAVLVRGRRAPIAGRVCMDLTMVDATDIPGVRQGDEVVLLGPQADSAISADEMAGWANTIPYEIFTSISTRVPRTYES